MEVKVVQDVSIEPVTLAEIKAFCRIDDDYAADDTVLTLLSKAAREMLEKQLNLSLAPKTLEVQFDGYQMYVPYGPVTEIEGLVSTKDPDTQVEYSLIGFDFPVIGVKTLDECYIVYPVGYDSNETAYNLTYTAGYQTLPSTLKLAVLMQIDYMYKNQGTPNIELSPDALNYAHALSKNLFIQY